MQKDSLILVVSTDSLSGEDLGYAIEGLQEVGAYNVNVIPSVTKKNRPGQMMVIDLPENREPDVGRFLSKELGISGYHRIRTEHVFERVNFKKRQLSVSGPNGWSKDVEMLVKVVGDEADPMYMDVESDFLIELKRELDQGQIASISLPDLRKMVESLIWNKEDPLILKVY